MTDESWGAWFRSRIDQVIAFFVQEFNKLLLTLILGYLFTVIWHMAHHPADTDSIHWFREQANLFSGGLLGLITGVRVGVEIGRKSQSATTTVEHTETTKE